MSQVDPPTSTALTHRRRQGAALPTLLVTLLLLGATPPQGLGKQVRLLIPILTGGELDQLRSLAPAAPLVSIDGATYLELGTFADARVAHRLGRSIQKRLAIPFDLAYDPDHPQVAIAFGEESLNHPPVQQATQPLPVEPPRGARSGPAAAGAPPPPKPPASDPFWTPLVASLPAADGALDPPVADPSPSPTVATTPTDPASTADTAVPAEPPVALTAAAVGDEASAVAEAAAISNPEDPQTQETTPTATEPVGATTPQPAPPAAPSELAQQAPGDPAGWILASSGDQLPKPEPAPVVRPEVEAAVTVEVPPVAAPTVAAPSTAHAVASDPATPAAEARHPWLRPVQIAAVEVEAPLSRAGVALNPQLNYLYVKVNSRADIQKLRGVVKTMELNPVGNGLVARVGVYTQTRTGQCLMNRQIEALQAQKVPLIVANAGEWPDVLA